MGVTPAVSTGQIFDHDSGWFEVSIDRSYEIKHNLDTRNVLAHIYFRPEKKGSVFYVNATNMTHSILDGLNVEIYDRDTVYVNTANSNILKLDNTKRYGKILKDNVWKKGEYSTMIADGLKCLLTGHMR